jgi:hypothetical protein
MVTIFAPPLRKVTSVCLAAVLLLGSIAPPAVRHVHALAEGAGTHHRHDADHHLAGAHGHHHDESGHHQAARGSEHAASMSSHWWHLHIQLLGLALTLPEPASRDDGRQSPRNDVLFLLAGQEKPFLFRATLWTEMQQLLVSPVFSATEDAAFTQIVILRPAPVSCAPLCDRARRERSGVLTA